MVHWLQGDQFNTQFPRKKKKKAASAFSIVLVQILAHNRLNDSDGSFLVVQNTQSLPALPKAIESATVIVSKGTECSGNTQYIY